MALRAPKRRAPDAQSCKSDAAAPAVEPARQRPIWASTEDGAAIEIGFLMVPDFPLLTMSGALDVLRHANRFAPKPHYRFRTFSSAGAAVRASNGLSIETNAGVDEDAKPHWLFVVCGFHPERITDERTLNWLRRLARRGVRLGGISAGAFILARAGLVKGRRCAVHWEYAGAFEEMWPEVELTDRLYVIETDRATCAGGSATIDMFLSLVSEDLGPDVAARAAEQMQIGRVRSTMDRQTSAALFRAKTRSSALAQAIEAMEGRMDQPLSMNEIARMVRLTRRQLHRLFREHTGLAPTDFYRDLRLRYARNLLRQTPTKVIDVALASGFGSHSHFSKVYREHFGVSPLKDRHNDY